MDLADPAKPAMSVIVVTEGLSDCLRWTLECLRSQTIASALECLLVTRSGVDLASVEEAAGPLRSLRVVEYKTMESTGAAKAAGVLAATAPLVVFAEDHAYPDARWAEALTNAHRQGRYAAIGPVVRNANPINARSWGCFLVYYGMYMTASRDGTARHLPGNHSSYRRDVLLEYGARLPEVLESEIALHGELLAKGMALRQEPEARVFHLNYSTIGPALREYYPTSRVFAAERSRRWGFARRWLYACGSPLVPLVRLKRIVEQARDAGLTGRTVAPALWSAAIVLCAGAAGEMLGYSLGPGDARQSLLRFEREHARLYTAKDLEAAALRQAREWREK
jgi:hypothetical protein